ncbi:MAG: glycerate kinase [Gammaproteobacteria bacterium]|nr:glycerate kinase [Gammaproteobacteria bacterium]
MKILIAPDSFKGNLSSLKVARAIEKGIRRVLPSADCIAVPMADGGEGTVRSMLDALGGKYIRKQVCGPDTQKVKARYGLLADGRTAVIEMAEASGLPLVASTKKNPLTATSYGTGELIVDALNKGANKIIIGIGGSATNDAGAGMAQALGVRFFNARGAEIRTPAAGGMLDKIFEINTDNLHPGLKKCRVVVASDVDNPLCGRRGASAIFGPQKGATEKMVKQLDENLKQFAKLIKQELQIDVRTLKGAGAAGGLGAGLVAFANARLRSGIDIVIEATQLKAQLKTADLVFTGEGRVDLQTAFGKTPAGVARAARRYRIPVVAIGGGLSDDARGVFDYGIDALDSAIARDMSLDVALKDSRKFIANASERALRLILVGKKMTKRR